MSNSFRSHYFHVIWSTKDGLRLITKELKIFLYAYIDGVIKYHHGALLAVGGTADHIHLLMCLNSPDIFSSLIRDLKLKTSIWINQHHPTGRRFAWEEGYGSFTLAFADLEQIKTLIQNQEQHHKNLSFRQEYSKLLEMHKAMERENCME